MTIDFGYPWWLSYGHLIPAAISIALLAAGYRRRWSRWPMILFGLLALWSVSGFLIARFVLDFEERGSLPTEAFLGAGPARVLDIGAGTGRSSIMVLEARPRTTLVALDLFGRSFEQHFGKGENPRQRLLANLKAAGVDTRATIETGDMRRLPFEPAAFDAIVSAYAMDHLNRQGSDEALAEAARVLKPGGEFLLMLVASDAWARLAFGPLFSHSARSPDWWTSHLKSAGFEIVEQGMRPATLYFLARRI